MDTTKKIKKLEKMRAKADKLKARVILGQRKLELKTETSDLKQDLQYLRNYNTKKGLEAFKSNLSEIRSGLIGLGSNQPSLKSLITREDNTMDTTKLTPVSNEPECVEVIEKEVSQQPVREEKQQGSMFDLPDMSLPMSDFSLDLPF